ncbi:hypothetical protein [Pseudomonas syringae]|uniref:hypothetical protein n=1 Tax=Pseudomonas syringae TaxID=317 RepID=UPI003F74DB16
MYYELIFKVLAPLVALSGWFKVFYDHFTSSPKISGCVLGIVRGVVTNGDEEFEMFLIYPYLLNKRKNQVHILEYEFSIRNGGDKKWRELTRLYGIDGQDELLLPVTHGIVKVRSFSENVIYKKKESSVQYGVPLHGWIPFSDKSSNITWENIEFKLACIDAYRKKHVIQGRQKDLIGAQLFGEMADVDFPRAMIPTSFKSD